MEEILRDPTPLKMVGALEANFQAHVPLYAHLPGAIAWETPEVRALLTDLDAYESCVYHAAFSPDQASEKIDQVLGYFRSQKCLPMQWIVGSSTRPSDLGKTLEERGFRYLIRVPGMAAPLQDLEKPHVLVDNFVIERVANSAQLAKWTKIVSEAEKLSERLREGYNSAFQSHGFDPKLPSQLFLGMEDGAPVAASRLLCAGGVAGIYAVTTLPEKRGRGYGTAMTLAAAQVGNERGYYFGGLFSSPAGYGLYRRLGFQEYLTIEVYMSPE